MDSDYRNSEVTIQCVTHTNGITERFYRRVEEIWELSYAGEKVPMFRVRWAKSVLKKTGISPPWLYPKPNPRPRAQTSRRKMSHGYWLPKWTNMLLHYRPAKAESCCHEERQKEDHQNGWSSQ